VDTKADKELFRFLEMQYALGDDGKDPDGPGTTPDPRLLRTSWLDRRELAKEARQLRHQYRQHPSVSQRPKGLRVMLWSVGVLTTLGIIRFLITIQQTLS